ncbi:MAG: PIN domain-containing protein [Candidatus Woesearchaeota archaeon]
MILDTTFLIDIMHGDKNAVAKLYELKQRDEPRRITSISIFELFTGVARCEKPGTEKLRVQKSLAAGDVVLLDEISAQIAGLKTGTLMREGITIKPLDCLIAGIALSRKETLLTRDMKDFSRIKGLQVESY